MDEEINIGFKLRHVRESQKMTQKQLSELSGLSTAFISQIERGKTDPSWSSLKKFSAALNIKIKDLFDYESPPIAMVKHGQGQHIDTYNIKRELLAATDDASMEMILTTFAPHTKSGKLDAHQGEEFIWVIDGTLEVSVGDCKYVLSSGDSVYYRSSVQHSWANKTSEACKVLWVMTPRSHT